MPSSPTALLERGGSSVGSFLSAFGGVKETRLTAALGFLAAKLPQQFSELLLGPRESIQRISIEEHNETGRLDLLVHGRRTLTVVEAKLGFKQQLGQVARYLKEVRRQGGGRLRLVLLDTGSESASPDLRGLRHRLGRRTEVSFLTWRQIARVCSKASKGKLLRKKQPFLVGMLQDFVTHLEEEGMVTRAEKEIYVRDLSGSSLARFFQTRIYRCQPEFYKSASSALYFAPYFTKRASGDLAPSSVVTIEPGISYVARIQKCERMTRKDVKPFLKANCWPDAKRAAKEILSAGDKEITVLLLEEPQRLFMTPVTKGRLGIRGAMGSRTFTLEDLLRAANRGD